MRMPRQESRRGVLLEPDMRCVDAVQCLAAPGQSQFEQYKFASGIHAALQQGAGRVNGRDNGRTVGSLRNVARTLCACLLVGLDIAPALADTPAPVPVEVAHGVFALIGQDGEIAPGNRGRIANIAFIVGPRGVVVVDSGVSFRHGQAIIAAVARVTRQPIRAVVITHPSQEVVFGAAAFQARRIPVLMHRSSAELMAARCEACLHSLGDVLGAQEMAGSRVVKPDRLVTKTELLDLIGRPLTLMAPQEGSAPGALAVYDPMTRTLIGGSLVSIDSVPDMRDANGKGWPRALAMLDATHCLHLVPAYGRIGSCEDIDALDGYFTALEQRVHELLVAGVGLAELARRSELPQFAAWDRYDPLNVQNANRAYLRMERASFAERDWNSPHLKE